MVKKFEAFDVRYIDANKVAVVALNRPSKMNCISFEQFDELKQVIEHLGRPESEVRAIVVTGIGKHFSAGLDLTSAMQMGQMRDEGKEDPARAAYKFFDVVAPLQKAITSLEQVRVPVIAAIHGFCIGAGVDLTSACDIRLCAKDTKFTIKEVDVGLAADVGTLQRFQKVVGNDSWTRELAYTARFFTADEALQKGYVSKVTDSAETCLKEAIALAVLIANKSPIAVSTTKKSLVYSRDHTVQEGLDHVATLNSVMLQTQDVAIAAMAAMQKTRPTFGKL